MTYSDYSRLKQQIIFSVGSSERHNRLLSSLKERFRSSINSTRRYEMITTIGQLINILELRDVISEDNVHTLKLIAQLLPNKDELLRAISNYEVAHVERLYINYYGQDVRQNPQESPPENNTINKTTHQYGMSKHKKEMIMKTVSEEIGTFWRTLGRSLKIREIDIQEIDSLNCSTNVKAVKLLERFEQRTDPQRWFFNLCEGLEKSRRKDLSVSIRDIQCWDI